MSITNEQFEALQARLAELEKNNAELATKNAVLREKVKGKEKAITYKVSEKGAVSAYGLQRFPITLYSNQWKRLLAPANIDALNKFMEENKSLLSNKDDV